MFSDAEAIAWFDVRDVVRAPARLDWTKIAHVNNHYIRLADDGRLADLTLAAYGHRGDALPADARTRLLSTIPLVKDGAKTILDLCDLCLFVMRDRPFAPDEKTRALLTEETRGRLVRLTDWLAAAPAWNPADLTASLRAFAAEEGVGLGKFGAPLRAVLAGGASAPDLASALTALGRVERVDR